MKKSKGKKAVNAVTIINGNDGPTSVFLVGKRGVKERNPLRRLRDQRERNRSEKRRAQVIKKLVAKPHTPDELAAYIGKKYYATELAPESSRAQEGWRNTKSSIVWREHREKMEELGYAPPEKKAPGDIHDQEAMKRFQEYLAEYSEVAASLDASLVPMDFHIYEIRTGAGAVIEVEMEKVRGLLNASFNAPKEGMRHAQGIMRDIYRYYGVSQEDIDGETDRYLTLVTMLTRMPGRKKRGGKRGRHRKKERTAA